MSPRERAAIVLVCTSALVVAGYRVHGVRAGSARLGERTDLRALGPGLRTQVPMGGLDLVVSVPAGEGVTGGSFQLTIPDLGIDSGALARDGSLEAAWIADVNEDERLDAVLVVRSGGSGSYASILVLESHAGGFVIHDLPEAPPASGYMGHDDVEVRGGRVVRSFPTYVDREGPRLDRQWTVGQGMHGELPVRMGTDSNSDPSGRTVSLAFDRTSGVWRELP